MGDKYNTIQQHEPLRVPSGWTAEEKRLIAQLEEILDDLYRRFNRLRLEDMGPALRGTIMTASDGVTQNSTNISQTAEEIRLTAQSVTTLQGQVTQHSTAIVQNASDISSIQQSVTQNSTNISQNANAISLTATSVTNIINGTTSVQSVENSAVEIKSSGVGIKTGGTFTVESGNFELDGEGNVSIKNADISGNLSMGGATVLTGKDIVISSSQPTETWPGLLWIRPIGNVSLTYRSNALMQTSFTAISSYPLTCLGTPVDTTGDFNYRLRFPYRCTTTSTLSDRYVTAILESGSHSVTITSRLKQYAKDGLAHGFMFDESFPGDVWLGSGKTVSLTLLLTSDASDPYKFYKLDSGTISLTCTAITGRSSGFITADVKVFQ